MKYKAKELNGKTVIFQYARYEKFVGPRCLVERQKGTQSRYTITIINSGTFYDVFEDAPLYAYTKEDNPEYFL